MSCYLQTSRFSRALKIEKATGNLAHKLPSNFTQVITN